jgi:hypothetical protein
MVILRQERIFYFKGKASFSVEILKKARKNSALTARFQGKFSECWMIIVYDTTGPSILLFKDQSAKKPIFAK